MKHHSTAGSIATGDVSDAVKVAGLVPVADRIVFMEAKVGLERCLGALSGLVITGCRMSGTGVETRLRFRLVFSNCYTVALSAARVMLSRLGIDGGGLAVHDGRSVLSCYRVEDSSHGTPTMPVR